MRSTLPIAILATMFLASACSKYDRELMGDPEPTPAPQQIEPSQPAEPAYSGEQWGPPETGDSLGVGEFNELRYYGQWHYLDPYGWVWRPTVVAEWQPFTQGHWIWTQYGWTWVDYDPWGWATSHYGFWTNDFAMGWVWIPDYMWSPAQCDWMIYDDYVCWAPVPPAGDHFDDPWEGDNRAWISVPKRKFKELHVANYRQTPKYKPELAANASRGAPDVREFETRGQKIPVTQVQLQTRVVGEREFAKVKFPLEQEQIIRHERVRMKNNDTTVRFTPPPPSSSGNDDSNVGPPPPAEKPKKETPAKSKDNGGSKDDGKKETKYKDRKDDGKSNDAKSGKKKG